MHSAPGRAVDIELGLRTHSKVPPLTWRRRPLQLDWRVWAGYLCFFQGQSSAC